MDRQIAPYRPQWVATPVPVNEPPQTSFELHDFLGFLRIHRKIIVATAAAVIGVAVVAVMMMTPIYTADAVVILDQRKNNVTDANAVLSGLPSDTTSVETQIQILTSTALANRAIKQLKLEEDPEFNGSGEGSLIGGAIRSVRHLLGKAPPPVDAAARKEMATALLDHVQASPVGLSTALRISASDADPAKAAAIANAFAAAYVEDQLAAKLEATHRATEWLTARAAELSRKAQEAEAAVQLYKAANNITTTGNGQSVVDQQINDVNGQLVAARADYGVKRATYVQLARLSQTGEAANAAPVIASPVITTLRAQQSQMASQLAQMESKYGPRHPKILDMRAEIEKIDDRIAQEVQRQVASARSDMDVAAAHVGALQDSLRQAENRGAGQNQASVKLLALQSDAATARQMYEAVLARLNQTQGQEQIEMPDARVISQAETPLAPSFPKKTRTVLLSIPAGLILGLFLAAMKDKLHSGFRTETQVQTAFGVPVLAVVPDAPSKTDKPSEIVFRRPHSEYSEAIRRLNIGLSSGGRDKRVIGVSSALPGEGKSTLVVSMARSAAERGLKTVIIDLDLRRAQIGKILDQRNARPNLAEALTGKEPLEQCLVKDRHSDVMALICSAKPTAPLDILSSSRVGEVIDRLREQFDLVLIDTPPLLPVSDTKLIARLSDAMVMAVRWEKTPQSAVARALRELAEVGSPLAGVALVRANGARFRYYAYGGHSDYESYYHA
jgi:capsular exopolysaccharide synthesis family protein